MSDDRQRGLYPKYHVTKLSDPTYESYFYVLDVFKDPFAIPALEAYANACADEYPILSQELKEMANRGRSHQVEMNIQKAQANEIAGQLHDSQV